MEQRFWHCRLCQSFALQLNRSATVSTAFTGAVIARLLQPTQSAMQAGYRSTEITKGAKENRLLGSSLVR